ncbi:RNA polymerase sigma factor [Paenibacillus sp. GbtcB18]|uniref:RNA polymerase sigma factor n=1 Tax=Paenibacillus sp. GbtcB18 TaxID=2824763 RepID=UPI001C2F37C8|nr:sigma-70 family RNA polymerase sigma factor [Paenibacillus sp. GbtcB18]
MQDDKQLIEQILQGNKQAFGQIIDRYKARVFALLQRMLGNSPDVQDIAQEVFIKAYNHLRDYKPEHSFSAWLYRIAANRCIDELRKRKRTPLMTGMDFDPVQTVTPESVFLEKERQQALESHLMDLDPNYRDVLVMRYIQFLSYQEIGEHLCIPVSTVQMRLYRARKKLRESLKDPEAKGAFLYEVHEI